MATLFDESSCELFASHEILVFLAFEKLRSSGMDFSWERETKILVVGWCHARGLWTYRQTTRQKIEIIVFDQVLKINDASNKRISHTIVQSNKDTIDAISIGNQIKIA